MRTVVPSLVLVLLLLAGSGPGLVAQEETGQPLPAPEALVELLGTPEEAASARRGLRVHAALRPRAERTLWLEVVAVSAALEQVGTVPGASPEDAGPASSLPVLLGRAVVARTEGGGALRGRPGSGRPVGPEDREATEALQPEVQALLEAVEELLDALRELDPGPGREDAPAPAPGVDDTPVPGLAGALDLAARIVGPVRPDRSLAWRRVALELDPGGPATGPLSIRLAGQLLDGKPEDGGGDDPRVRAEEASALLEAFVVDRPADPLAPEARRLRARALRQLESLDSPSDLESPS